MEDRKSVEEYRKLIGDRIRAYRISLNMQQKELCDEVGIHTVTLRKIEQGKVVTFDNIIRVLTALHLEHNLEGLIPDYTKSPLYGMSPVRYRVHKSHKKKE